jgi:hypothetical protein
MKEDSSTEKKTEARTPSLKREENVATAEGASTSEAKPVLVPGEEPWRKWVPKKEKGAEESTMHAEASVKHSKEAEKCALAAIVAAKNGDLDRAQEMAQKSKVELVKAGKAAEAAEAASLRHGNPSSKRPR